MTWEEIEMTINEEQTPVQWLESQIGRMWGLRTLGVSTSRPMFELIDDHSAATSSYFARPADDTEGFKCITCYAAELNGTFLDLSEEG